MGDVGKGACVDQHRVCSVVCIRVGLRASLSSTVMAPATSSCSAVMGLPRRSRASWMRPIRARKSSDPGQRQNGHQLGGGGDDEAIGALDPSAAPPWPRVRWRSARSFMSRCGPEDVGRVDIEPRQAGSGAELVTEFAFMEQAGIPGRQSQVVGGGEGVKIPGEVQVHLPHRHHLGHAAPAAPPLTPKTGPRLGWRMVAMLGWPMWIEPHGEADRGDCLALPRGGRDGAHQHQLPGSRAGA